MTASVLSLPRGSREKSYLTVDQIIATIRARYMVRVRIGDGEEVDVVWWWPPEDGIITWIYGVPRHDDGSLMKALHALFETRGSDGKVPLPVRHIAIYSGLDEIHIIPDERRRHEKRPLPD